MNTTPDTIPDGPLHSEAEIRALLDTLAVWEKMHNGIVRPHDIFIEDVCVFDQDSLSYCKILLA